MEFDKVSNFMLYYAKFFTKGKKGAFNEYKKDIQHKS